MGKIIRDTYLSNNSNQNIHVICFPANIVTLNSVHNIRGLILKMKVRQSGSSPHTDEGN